MQSLGKVVGINKILVYSVAVSDNWKELRRTRRPAAILTMPTPNSLQFLLLDHSDQLLNSVPLRKTINPQRSC